MCTRSDFKFIVPTRPTVEKLKYRTASKPRILMTSMTTFEALIVLSLMRVASLQIFTSFFEMNSRWSERQPVPKLGGPNASFKDVENFYAFWYDFQSWREFSYLDEEEKESGMEYVSSPKYSDSSDNEDDLNSDESILFVFFSRDQRRWIDKQNKVMRLKRKKDEMARIRTLVDLAYSMDPRVAAFKQEEVERKLAAKKARQEAARAKQIEQEKVS